MRRKRGFGKIERDILEQLTLGDFLYSFLLSAHSTRQFYKLANERAAQRYRRKRALARLTELGLIQARGQRLSLTDDGRSALGFLVKKYHSSLQQNKWDGKWRVVAFDIPEKLAVLRNKVRAVLKEVGFKQLQQSVWVFPHECKELVELIRRESDLSKHILYGVLEQIEDEQRLKKVFDLKL